MPSYILQISPSCSIPGPSTETCLSSVKAAEEQETNASLFYMRAR